MPNEKVKTTEEQGNENLQTEAPIGERDEVKQAEERTRKLQEEAEPAGNADNDSAADD